MRIVFTGSHGVGKSTLFDRIYSLIPLPFAFDSFVRNHPNLKNYSARTQQRYTDFWYIWKQYLTPSYIASRSIYDTWAYAKLTVHPDFHYHLMKWAVRHIWYDYVFYVPIEFPLVNDGVRFSDPSFQIAHDKTLKLILDYHGVPYHTIRGTVDERVQQVKDILGYD